MPSGAAGLVSSLALAASSPSGWPRLATPDVFVRSELRDGNAFVR